MSGKDTKHKKPKDKLRTKHKKMKDKSRTKKSRKSSVDRDKKKSKSDQTGSRESPSPRKEVRGKRSHHDRDSSTERKQSVEEHKPSYLSHSDSEGHDSKNRDDVKSKKCKYTDDASSLEGPSSSKSSKRHKSKHKKHRRHSPAEKKKEKHRHREDEKVSPDTASAVDQTGESLTPKAKPPVEKDPEALKSKVIEQLHSPSPEQPQTNSEHHLGKKSPPEETQEVAEEISKEGENQPSLTEPSQTVSKKVEDNVASESYKQQQSAKQTQDLQEQHKESTQSDKPHKDSGESLTKCEEVDVLNTKSSHLAKLRENPGRLFDPWKVNLPKAVQTAGNSSEGGVKILDWQKCDKINNHLRRLRKESRKLERLKDVSKNKTLKMSSKSSGPSKTSAIEKSIRSGGGPTSLGSSKRSLYDQTSTKLVYDEGGLGYQDKSTVSNVPQTPELCGRADAGTFPASSSEEAVGYESSQQPAERFQSFKIPKKVLNKDAFSQMASNELLTSKGTQLKGKTSDDAATSSLACSATDEESSGIKLDYTWSSQHPDSQRTTRSFSTVPVHDMETDEEMEIVEELHTARYERILEVEVDQSYGELTRMEIDPPQELKISFPSQVSSQRELIVVLDTNIFISHLNFINTLRDIEIPGLGFPIILIPWVVLQELDALKNGKLSGGVNRKAVPAVQFIFSCFQSRSPNIWGQSMQQAAKGMYGLRDENNDDRVLQCCLQYTELYPCAHILLCSDDKNLCTKALVSGVRAVRKVDLITEFNNLKPNRDVPNPKELNISEQPQAETSRREQNGTTQESLLNVVDIFTQLEKTLGIALSAILETEMKIAYEELWMEVIFLKPPWSLSDLLQCMKKHWIAVFGIIVKRNLLSSVEILCDHFHAGRKTEYNCLVLTWLLNECQNLLHAFSSRSDYGGVLQETFTVMNELYQKVSEMKDGSKIDQNAKSSKKPQESHEMQEKVNEPPLNSDPGRNATLVPLNSNHAYGQEMENSRSFMRSREIWATFENIWTIISQYSSIIFATFSLPHNPTASLMNSKLPLPQEAFMCLQRLMPAVKELLAAIQRIMCSDSSVQDFQKLAETVHNFLNYAEAKFSISRIFAQELYECFTHEEYRKKLIVGCSQLAEVTYSLEQCNTAICLEARNRGWI
uniref:Transcriptional protein SWT1 n=1 Tax=Callorhinchus milii TaxID=7868 RepID=V9K891_CALMI